MRKTTAAIIGTGWGQIYVPPLRQAGIDITAIFDLNRERAIQVAKDLGIPLGTHQLKDLGTPDILVVASPASTHLETIHQFQDTFIICEKPLVGWQGNLNPQLTDRVWINYAFPQVTAFQQFTQEINQAEGLSISLSSSVNLPLTFNTPQWFLETASHPLSGLLHWLGAPQVLEHRLDEHSIKLDLVCGCSNTLHVEFKVGGPPGIHHEMIVNNGTQNWTLPASYVPDQPWQIGSSELGLDPWLAANYRSIQLLASIQSGDVSPKEAKASGAFNWQKALWLESTLSLNTIGVPNEI